MEATSFALANPAAAGRHLQLIGVGSISEHLQELLCYWTHVEITMDFLTTVNEEKILPDHMRWPLCGVWSVSTVRVGMKLSVGEAIRSETHMVSWACSAALTDQKKTYKMLKWSSAFILLENIINPIWSPCAKLRKAFAFYAKLTHRPTKTKEEILSMMSKGGTGF